MHKTPVNEQDEITLLERLSQGDHLAFGQIYDRYKTELAIRILRLVKADELAEELLQDVFLKLWHNRAQLDTSQPVRAYLYAIARNLAIDLLRRAAKQQHIYDQIIHASTELYDHIERSIFQKENEAWLREAIDKLPPQRQKVFVQCKLEGKTYKEVAELYQISTTTVNDHIQKSTHFIREYLLKQPGFQLSVVLAVLFH